MTRRVVLDTNIIVTGFGWGGVPGLVLDAAFDGRFVAVTSVALLREVEDVIRRSKLAAQFPDPAVSSRPRGRYGCARDRACGAAP